MVLPITYPPAETTGLNADAWNSWKIIRIRTRQKKPYNLPLPYTFEFHRTIGADIFESAFMGPGIRNRVAGYSPWERRSFSARDHPPPEWSEIENRLHGKFISEWRTDASLGASLAESRQAWSMMFKRIGQLYLFGRHLKRLDFVAAAKALGVLKHPEYLKLKASKKLRRGSHSFASNYLEFHFGWSPLIGDLGDCMDVLSSEIPLGHYKTRSGTPKRSPTTGGTSSTYWKDGWEHYVRCFGEVGADISVSNPNLYLYSSLGLTNPAVVLWEIVPFSFVFDWFVGVQTFLQSYTDYHGIKVENPYMTKVCKVVCISEYAVRNYPWLPWVTKMSGFCSETVTIVRSTNLPQLTLQAKTTPLFEGKPRRALAAIALLIQQGLGKH